MNPVTTTALESYSSVYGITCGDIMYEYVVAKSERKRPEATADLANKIMDCFHTSIVKIQESPCNELRQSYAECLSSGAGRMACRTTMSQLQECTAKHVGRLDD